ncbi:profilin-1 [Aulostomus maculatus]
MSWSAYIDMLMNFTVCGIQPVEEAAICGLSDHTVWASSPGLSHLTSEEIKQFTGIKTDLGQNGPCLAGIKCRMLRDNFNTDKMFCMDLKSAKYEDGSTSSYCVGKTNQALIIVKGKKDVCGGSVTEATCYLVDYLRNNNS